MDGTTVELWFDERPGTDPPVVLLHGGLCTADTWAMQVDAFGPRRVLLPEQRGHGHTPDPGEISYPLMAADTVAFLERNGGGPADLVGWSDGGNVGLHVALDRPDLVRKLVVIGSNFHHEGSMDELVENMDADDSMLRGFYEAVSPDGPDHWPTFKSMCLDMWRTGPTLTVEDVRRIEPPVLVLVGDDDAVHLDHTVALYENLPAGQLAVIPGSSHLVPLEKPALVNQLVVDFLDDGAVVSLAPMRRS